MMTIRSAKFMFSLDKLRPFPGQGLPEIAMAGKSNVGKSSMINSLLGNSKLARISSEPGKTRLVNFYRVNGQFWLVDLPGYGFAKATKADKLSRAARGRSIPVICRTLAVQPWEVIPYSSEDDTGREKILELLENETMDGCDTNG